MLTHRPRYATEIDVDFVRKSVRAIGKLAIKIAPAAQLCISTLLSLVSTKVSYIVQEATVVIRNIFRKYPNQYESIISTLCENLDSLDEPEAKAAMIWVIGQYADRIEDSDVLLEDFLDSFLEETHEVQLALLTATVKLFIQRPTRGSTLCPRYSSGPLKKRTILIYVIAATCTGGYCHQHQRKRRRWSWGKSLP